MTEIKFNLNTCNKCGICVQECPNRYIIAESNEFPSTKPDGFCIECGHCEAICPLNAVELVGDKYSLIDIPNGVKAPSSDEFLSLVANRRSARWFTEQIVEKETIEKIIALTQYAPTGKNIQSVNWIIIHSEEEIIKLTEFIFQKMQIMIDSGNPLAKQMNFESMVGAWKKHKYNSIFRTAPHLAITYAPNQGALPLVDSTIALTHFDLALPTFGLGGTWAGYFFLMSHYFPEIAQELNVPEGCVITGGIFFGYSKSKYQRIPKRKLRPVIWK